MSPSIQPAPAPATRDRSWSEVHRSLFPDSDFPARSWELDVCGYLFERGYPPGQIGAILDVVEALGSVECFVGFRDACDRAAVEALLPVAPAGVWAQHEGATWEPPMMTDRELCSTMRARALGGDLAPLDAASVLAAVCALVAIARDPAPCPQQLALRALRVLAMQQPMEVPS